MGLAGTNATQTRAEHWFSHVPRSSQVVLDVVVLIGAFIASYLLRFDFRVPAEELRGGLVQLPYVVLIQFVALAATGVYSFVWRYVGMSELRTFGKAALYSALPILALRFGLPESLIQWQVPRSIILVDTLLAFGGVLSLRIASRGLYERFNGRGVSASTRTQPKSILMIGAGRAGLLTAREMQGGRNGNRVIRGFVDDDPKKVGAVIQGVKVLGTTDDLPRLVHELDIDHVVITIAHADRREIRRVLGICNDIGIKTRIIPALHEILEGKVEISRTREVSIEDLLGRDPVSLDEKKLSGFLTNKTVMVTGAGGSIGSELVRQVARFHPSRLVLVERAEFALFEIDREMRPVSERVSIVPVIGDVGDAARMRFVLSQHRPHVIIHAAAHKHVPMMEDNPSEAIKNNVIATRTLAEIAGELGVGAFVQISTDKAVRPTSVMGASKRLAELVIQDLDARVATTRYLAVRFGNVLGSAGSVIPIFRDQVARGGPVTVTTPDMVRYFMTIPEAAQLVLQAGAMGKGGEIFVLDMGQPVKILDLAKDMIRLSGLVPYEDIDIVFSGARPGEKRFEELEMTGEHMTKTRHPKILIGKLAGCERSKLRRGLRTLDELSRSERPQEIHALLNELLPEANLTVAHVSAVESASRVPLGPSRRADSRHSA